MRKKELEKIVKFLCNHNKDDIGATLMSYGFPDGEEIKFKYLYDGKLMETEYVWGANYKVVSNSENKAIIKVYCGFWFGTNSYKYYELDKANAKLFDITNYYKEKDNGKDPDKE